MTKLALTNTQIERISAAAADPVNWKIPSIKRPRKKTSKLAARRAKEHHQDLRYEKNALNSDALISAAITALVDLAPERFGWEVVDLCEKLIDAAAGPSKPRFGDFKMRASADTAEFMEHLTRLISFYSPAVYTEALGHITALMIAGSVSVCINGSTFINRRDIIRKGWATA